MVRQLKSSERKALIAFIKPRKKKFYKGLWKWYGNVDLLISMGNVQSSPIKTALTYFPGRYSYVAELRIIYLVLLNDLWEEKLRGVIGLDELVYLHKKYWERFHKYYVFPRTKKQIPFPHMNKTKAVAEFLARGFIHKDDAIDFRGKKYTVECTIAPLVWPQAFDQHGDACKTSAEVGIHGYTKCPIPK